MERTSIFDLANVIVKITNVSPRETIGQTLRISI